MASRPPPPRLRHHPLHHPPPRQQGHRHPTADATDVRVRSVAEGQRGIAQWQDRVAQTKQEDQEHL